MTARDELRFDGQAAEEIRRRGGAAVADDHSVATPEGGNAIDSALGA